MNCNYTRDNGAKCKMPIKKQLDGINYCTRHYNKLIKLPEHLEQLEINKLNSEAEDIDEFFNTKHIKSILKSFNLKPKKIKLIHRNAKVHIYRISLNNIYYIFKLQNLQNTDIRNYIHYEYLVLQQLYNTKYIVSLYNHESINNSQLYYKKDKYIGMITEYLNDSLYNKKLNYTFSIDEIKKIAIHLILIMRHIHSNQYLYLNLQPANIMFDNDNNIKLIDFNCCNKYISFRSEFFENIELTEPIGNLLFSSININKSFSGLRIDDIESILWIILYLLDHNIFINDTKKEKIINEPNGQSKWKDYIIKSKKKIIDTTTNMTCNFPFIVAYIEELRLYDNKNNKIPNYKKFINILQ